MKSLSELLAYVPRIGMFALVAIGIHAGANRIDEEVFSAINFIDGLFDALLTVLIETVGRIRGTDPGAIAHDTFAAISFIDLDDKVRGAKYLALAIELLVIAMIAIPLLRPEDGESDIRGALKRALTDPTLYRWALPLSILGAACSGTVLVAEEMQANLHASVHALIGGDVVATLLARAFAFFSLLLTGGLLGARAALHAIERSDRLSRWTFETEVLTRYRRLDGFWTAAISLPLVFIAITEGTPLVSTLRAIVLP